jgi:tetraacyldisaccharide 4'-kinase
MLPRAPDFWRTDNLAARLLAPAGALWGALAAARLARERPHAALPAIVVGGLTAGGDGKTPLVLTLAALLAARGETPAILTRGFGGRRSRGVEPFVVGSDASAEVVGDEPLLLAREAPTIVCRDRAAGARLARDMGASVVILDDGFHSRCITPDFAILVIDSEYAVGNGRCLPAGPLRAPFAAQAAHADALVIVGDGTAAATLARRASKMMFHARIVVEPDAVARGARVVAFAGIGRPEKFFRTLAVSGAGIVAQRAFPDHHRYRPRDIAELAALARRLDARLTTTGKDAVRWPAHGPEIDVLPIRLEIADEAALGATLTEALRKARLSRAS